MFYIRQVLIALDQLVNTLIGGYADETLSAAIYRYSLENKRWAKICRWVLDLILTPKTRTHCKGAYESEIFRRQYPSEYRKRSKDKI